MSCFDSIGKEALTLFFEITVSVTGCQAGNCFSYKLVALYFSRPEQKTKAFKHTMYQKGT